MDDQKRAALVESRISQVISAAIAGLSPTDRAERIAYCRRTGLHGTNYRVSDGEVELFWPQDRLLAVIPQGALSEEALRHPLSMTALDVPDSPAGLDDQA